MKALGLILGIIALIVIGFGISGLIFWGIGAFIIWVFGISFVWTFWHGLAVTFIVWTLSKIFRVRVEKS